MEDPFINSAGKKEKPTRVHELVYNKRMQLPHSRRKTRFAREILAKMKEDKEVRLDEERSDELTT
jgi:hypothetical protein